MDKCIIHKQCILHYINIDDMCNFDKYYQYNPYTLCIYYIYIKKIL